MKKRILVLAPVMPQESDIAGIANTLVFLHKDFQIDFIDPLSVSDALSNAAYYRYWESTLKKQLAYYDAFLGFAFGGVILQQCFSLFTGIKKPILLFSTPSFANESLQEKLGKVIRLCKETRVIEALSYLYDEVFYPNKPPVIDYAAYNKDIVARRLIIGLQRVLDTDSTNILKDTTVDHLHLIGECSNLVNSANVIAPKTGLLLIVPAAGMRVLQDNQVYCKNLILERLGVVLN